MRDWDFGIWSAYVLSALLVAVGLSAATGCSTAPKDYKRGALADQILLALPGHTGLVSSECIHDPKSGACVWDYVEYDLNDAATRQRLRDAGFVCLLSGKAYIVSSDQPGLIFETYDRFLGIGPKRGRIVDYIPISNYQSLIDQKTQCLSEFTFKYYERTSQ